MARPNKYTNEVLINFVNMYKLQNPNIKIKLTDLTMFMNENGLKIKTYILQRPQYQETKNYIDNLNEKFEDETISTTVYYKPLNIEQLLNIKDKQRLKEVLFERDEYFKKIATSASYFIEENKRLKACNEELAEEIKELKLQAETINEIEHLKEKISNLEQTIENYLYPEIANKIIENEGLITTAKDVIKSVPTIKTEEIKNDLIKDLIGDFDD